LKRTAYIVLKLVLSLLIIIRLLKLSHLMFEFAITWPATKMRIGVSLNLGSIILWERVF